MDKTIFKIFLQTCQGWSPLSEWYPKAILCCIILFHFGIATNRFPHWLGSSSLRCFFFGINAINADDSAVFTINKNNNLTKVIIFKKKTFQK